jgi:hypothetical protein
LCCDFKEKKIVPTHYAVRSGPGPSFLKSFTTHYAIRTWEGDPGNSHLKSWLVETSADGKSWRKVSREEDNEQLNGRNLTGTFPVAGSGDCGFIRLVNIGRNHRGSDALAISAWEIFGSLVE